MLSFVSLITGSGVLLVSGLSAFSNDCGKNRMNNMKISLHSRYTKWHWKTRKQAANDRKKENPIEKHKLNVVVNKVLKQWPTKRIATACLMMMTMIWYKLKWIESIWNLMFMMRINLTTCESEKDTDRMSVFILILDAWWECCFFLPFQHKHDVLRIISASVK